MGDWSRKTSCAQRVPLGGRMQLRALFFASQASAWPQTAIPPRTHYASHRASGLPCGSSPTEGACKSVVKARACRSGQRWHPEGVDNVLTLRALAQSERLPRAFEVLRRDYYVADVRLAA